MPSTSNLRAIDHLVAALLFVGYTTVLVATPDMGFTRDESFYFHAADQYKGWFVELAENHEHGDIRPSFAQTSIDRHWSYNPEHPVLVKTAFALSGLVLHDKLGWLSRSEAYRLPGMIAGALTVACLYLFTLVAFRSRLAAIVAAVLLATMPHFFFHAHLTCFDIPVVAVWLLFMYAYYRSLTSTRWAWAAGVMWGVGLITKLNAFFLPIVVLLHWGLRALGASRIDRTTRLTVPPVPLALFTMALVGPIVFYVGWPRHWFETWSRTLWYLNFHLGHEHYYVRYFGLSLWEPPFPRSYPYVMTLTTTPVPTLVAFFYGVGVLLSAWRRRVASGERDPLGTGLLVSLNAFIPFWIISRPDTPIFGGVKHWMPAIPFCCMIAGVGVARVRDIFAAWGRRLGLAAAGAAVVPAVAVAALDTADSHPFGAAYFNAAVGYYTGAADLKGMRHFWGYTSRAALPFLNQNVPENGSVHFHDSTGLAVEMYKDEQWLRRDVRPTWAYDASDYIALDPEEGFAGQLHATWTRFGTQSPVYNGNLRGVPMISVYRNLRKAGVLEEPAAPTSAEVAARRIRALLREREVAPSGRSADAAAAAGGHADDGSGRDGGDDDGSGARPDGSREPAAESGDGEEGPDAGGADPVVGPGNAR